MGRFVSLRREAAVRVMPAFFQDRGWNPGAVWNRKGDNFYAPATVLIVASVRDHVHLVLLFGNFSHYSSGEKFTLKNHMLEDLDFKLVKETS